MGFNKQIFANLLTLAKGKRSINKYGIDSDVDPGYISRLLRCLIDTPPSAIVIKKLADKSYNRIKAEELMAAAGYLEVTKEIDLLDVLEDNTTSIKAAGKTVTPEQRVEILKTLDEAKPKLNYEEMYKHPLLADLLMRVPDLTGEEKQSLADHLEVALELIERERQKRKQRGEL